MAYQHKQSRAKAQTERAMPGLMNDYDKTHAEKVQGSLLQTQTGFMAEVGEFQPQGQRSEGRL